MPEHIHSSSQSHPSHPSTDHPRDVDIHLLMEEHGIRPTPNRVLVADALCRSPRPMSMTELEDELESVDKSGISRTLALFREHRMVHVLEDGSESVRYELCLSHDEGHDEDAHVHFYCNSCRRTFCLYDIPIPGISLPRGYTQDGVNYMIKGLCPECSGKK